MKKWVQGHCSGARGIVSVEMLIAFFPVLVTFLGVIQLALLFIGELVVTHAANRAVRSAIVVLDDDPKYYDDAPRGDLERGKVPQEGTFSEFWSGVNENYTWLLGDEPPTGGARLDAIRTAAYHPLSVLAPAGVLGDAESLADELGGPSVGAGKARITLPELRLSALAFAYNRAAAAITVHTEPDGPSVTEVAPDDEVTVRVAYLMKCGVPLVSALFCQSGTEILGASLGLQDDEKAIDTREHLTEVAQPILRDTLFVGGGHFRLIVAQATLPNHGAEYNEED